MYTQERSLLRKMRNFLIVFCIVGGAGWVAYDGTLVRFIERDAPTIEWVTPLDPIGRTPRKIGIRVKDSGAGIGRVRVTALGKSPEAVITEQSFTQSNASKTEMISFVVDPKITGIKEGDLRLKVVVEDLSFWKNSAEKETSVPIDRISPSIELVSSQHNGKQGGTVVVFYQPNDKYLKESGVFYNEEYFRGFKLPKEHLPATTNNAPIYMALVPIRATYLPKRDGELQVYARDQAGNQSEIPIYQSIRPIATKAATLPLTDTFVRTLQSRLEEQVTEVDSSEKTDLEGVFRSINETLRKANQKKILKVSNKTTNKFFPNKPLIKPMASELTASFLEQRTYKLNGKDVGTSIHEGYDLAKTQHAEIMSAATGRVLWADDLGIYGKAVIIDHGFGLQTLYGHLSSTSVAWGDQVTAGDIIGHSGSTGLAGGDHLHFEVRVQGVPVDPKEWLDPQWIRTRLVEPITQVINQSSTPEVR